MSKTMGQIRSTADVTTPQWQESIHLQALLDIVNDTGPGILKKHLPLIFDRFHVVDAARTRCSISLGLAIAKTLVESQNGQPVVTSSANNGTTFKVTLPCQKQP